MIFSYFLRYLQFTWIFAMALGSTYQCRTCCGGFQPHCPGVATWILQIFSPIFSRFCGPILWGRTENHGLVKSDLDSRWLTHVTRMPLKLFNSFVEILFFPQSHEESHGAIHIYTPHTLCTLWMTFQFETDLFDFFELFPWEKTRSLLCWSRFVNGRLRIRSPSQADPHCKYFLEGFFQFVGRELPNYHCRQSGMTGFEGYLRGDTILLLAILAVARVSNPRMVSPRGRSTLLAPRWRFTSPPFRHRCAEPKWIRRIFNQTNACF